MTCSISEPCRGWLLALLLVTGVRADPTLEELHQLRADFVTPHTRWCDQLPGGPLRVLYISAYRNCAAREMVELAQRFPLTADAVYYDRVVDTVRDDWVGGPAGLRRLVRLLDTRRYDCFLLNHVPLLKLPAECQYKLLRQVTEGAGLVAVGFTDARVCKHPLTEPRLNPEAGYTRPKLYEIVKGRGAVLPDPELYAPPVPNPRVVPVPPPDWQVGWEVYYDHWQERLGRTLLWVAGKLPSGPLAIGLTGPAFARRTVAQPIGTLKYGSLPRWRVRRDDGLAGCETAIADGLLNASVALTLPPLPAGHYHLDAFSGSDWTTTTFNVTSARRARLDLATDWAELGGALAGTVTLTGPALAGERLAVELRDRGGRILRRTALTPTKDAASFKFAVDDSLPMLTIVRAVLSDAAGDVCDSLGYFNVTKRGRGRFNFLVWDVPRGATAPWAEEALTRLGMSLQLVQSPPTRFAAAYDIPWVPYVTRIQATKDRNGLLTPVPWNMSPEVDREIARVVAPHVATRRHGAFVYSLGDEVDTRGSDVSFSDLRAYQHYLGGVYGTVARLNAEWGTQYKAFGDIELLDAKDPSEAAARTAGNTARWFDRQAFESRNFLDYCTRWSKAIAALDPQARTGFEGAGRLDRADDLEGFIGRLGFWSPYRSSADQVVRSLAPRDFPRSNWIGYERDAEPLLTNYWRSVLNGSDSVWYWRWDGIGRFMGLLRPDLTPPAEIAEMVADTRILRDGLGDWLLNATMQDQGLGLYYSLPSLYAAQLTTERPADEHAAWHSALFAAGLNFRYVTAATKLDPKALPLLILPRAEALSEAEVQALTAYVAAGGRLVADVRPARYDEHCKLRAKPALDALFASGKAVLLDLLPSAQAPADGGWLAKVGVKPAVATTPHLRIVRWRRGEVEVVGAQRDVDRGQVTVPLKLDAPRWVYDLRAQRAIGVVDTLPLELKCGRAAWYALLPAAPGPLELSLTPAVAQRGQAQVLSVKGAAVALVTATGPDGREAAWARRVSTAGSVPWSWAVNEAAGAWRLTVRDVVTGRSGEVRVGL